MGILESVGGALEAVPWDIVIAALLGFGICFYIGKFFAEDAGEQERYEYLSGKRRLRE